MASEAILVVHPEGNISNNANLSALAGACFKAGYRVDILSQYHGHMYQSSFVTYRVVLLKKISMLLVAKRRETIRGGILRALLGWVGKGYGLILGVDKDGIVIGNIIAQCAGIPLGLISYEIVFGAEIGASAKHDEIRACEFVRFAICQDSVRADRLANENKIPRAKILCVPVAGRGLVYGEGNKDYLRKRFGIAKDKKIALHMGSVADWAGIGRMLEDLTSWPDDWVLVVHGRFAGEDQYGRVQALCKRAKDKLYLSKEPFEQFEQLYQLPLSADIGIATYYPDWAGPLTGNNLQYLGLSSGKVAAYLQCGLPVIVNETGRIADDVRKYGLGYVIRNGQKISDILKNIDKPKLEKKRQICKEYFSNTLDFDNYRENTLQVIRGCYRIRRKAALCLPVTFFAWALNIYVGLYGSPGVRLVRMLYRSGEGSAP